MTEQEREARRAAVDWRRDYYGPGEHGRFAMVPTIMEPAYPRDVAMLGNRERWALADRWQGSPNGDAFTTHVFRHPEYRAAILRHDPRSVFYPIRERRIRALRELRRIAERNAAYRARFGS